VIAPLLVRVIEIKDCKAKLASYCAPSCRHRNSARAGSGKELTSSW
jgi:hypothetical protein